MREYASACVLLSFGFRDNKFFLSQVFHINDFFIARIRFQVNEETNLNDVGLIFHVVFPLIVDSSVQRGRLRVALEHCRRRVARN